MAKFHERLRALRVSSGLSQSEFAKLIKLSKSSVNMYERGEREPGLATLEHIADYFNVDMDYLLGKSDVVNKAQLSMTTGQRMRIRRQEIGLTAEAVADILGVSPATIYRYENGEIEEVPGDRLEPIASALRTTPAYLMGWDDSEAAQTSSTQVHSGMSLNRFILKLQAKHPQAFEALSRACSSIEWASRAINNPCDPAFSDDFPLALLTEEEKHLLAKYRQLDERGRASVRNILDHEYTSSTGETPYSSAKEA